MMAGTAGGALGAMLGLAPTRTQKNSLRENYLHLYFFLESFQEFYLFYLR